MPDHFADLHIHTYYSDSTMSPEEVVTAAKDFGLSAIAITDHDAIDGIAPARAAAGPLGLEVVKRRGVIVGNITARTSIFWGISLIWTAPWSTSLRRCSARARSA